MSAQPSEFPKMPLVPKIEDQEEPKSVLDEPWRVTMLPDGEVPTIAVASPEAAPPPKSLPWKPGDVARLRDDSPEGMMRYIATHTTGWWQEMAERALRDTEKARRMAEESGWQPGQYWTLEPDVEAKEKMRAQEAARRQREEQERAKERAEKEAFAARQMELLKKAGRAPRCEYLYTDGRSCRAPQVRGERWCHGHAKMMSYRPEKLELLPMEDEQSVTVNLYRVTRSLLSGRITEKMAGLMLWSVAIAAPYAAKISPRRARRTQRRGKANPKPLKRRGNGVSGGNKCHSGVTNHKSFVSGVGRGGTPSGDLVIGRSGDRKSKGLPRMNDTRGSIKKPAQLIRRSKKQHLHSSVSPCLRGEIRSEATKRTRGRRVTALKSTELHSHAQAGTRGGHL